MMMMMTSENTKKKRRDVHCRCHGDGLETWLQKESNGKEAETIDDLKSILPREWFNESQKQYH